MKDHRSTQDSVSKKTPPDNFHASDAIESLHAAILRVETMAQVAIDAVDQLRCPAAPAVRRAFARMQILVAKAAGEASAALAEGDKLIAELAQHMRGRSDPARPARKPRARRVGPSAVRRRAVKRRRKATPPDLGAGWWRSRDLAVTRDDPPRPAAPGWQR